MPLAYLDFCQRAARHIAAQGLQLGRKLLLGKPARFPKQPYLLPDPPIILKLHSFILLALRLVQKMG